MRYFVTCDGQEWEVELTGEGVRLNEEMVHVELSRLPGSPELHLRLGDRGFPLAAVHADGHWIVNLYGRSFQATVEDERARAVRELAGSTPDREASRELRAPMPGLVLKVFVNVGQTIEAGDPLVVVEAMKMENELRAERAGRVTEVAVAEGDIVSQNDLLVVFE